MKARIYGRVVASEVDGPGVRAVVHFAGCSVRCPGCFNKDLWEVDGPGVREVDVADLAEEILFISTDVTLSGGEPTDQAQALYGLLAHLHGRATSVILFTGKQAATANLEAAGVDAVIDGPYDASQPETTWLRGSTNQRILVLSDRLSYAEMKARNVQVLVIGDQLVVTGFPTADLIGGLS